MIVVYLEFFGSLLRPETFLSVIFFIFQYLTMASCSINTPDTKESGYEDLLQPSSTSVPNIVTPTLPPSFVAPQLTASIPPDFF